MQNVRISLIVPTYNEELIIEDTIRSALCYLERNFSEYELIIADDGSTDSTCSLVRAICDPHLHLVCHMPNSGKGSAVRQGMQAAGGDILVYTDADLAYGLEVIGLLTEKLVAADADLVIGSRKLHPDGYADYPPIRLLASRCFSFMTGVLAGFHYDTQCGIKAFRAAAAKKVFSSCVTDGFAFDFEVMMLCQRMGMVTQQQPVTVINHRESSVNVIRDSLKMFGDVLRIRRSVAARMKQQK